MTHASIKVAVERQDFLAVCVQLLAEYGGVTPAFSETEVRDAAAEAGCQFALERDEALAPLALASQLAIKNYADLSNVPIRADDGGEIWLRTKKKNNQEVRASSKIIICGEGHEPSDGGACLELLIKATNGAWNRIFVSRADLVTGKELQGRLQAVGLLPGKYPALLHLLQNVDPPHKFTRLTTAGWSEGYYALPNGEVIPDDGRVQATFDPVPYFNVGGDGAGSEELLKVLDGQSRIQFAICAALAAPILAHYGPDAEPGGFHFFGPSSRGKTTLLAAAASMWGVGAEKKDYGIIESWNTTNFAAENTAAQHSDCALFMDEVKAAKPEDFAKLNLQLTNGAGKKAGTSSGAMRETKTFRPMVISTGEISARQYIESNDLEYHAGMAVRFVDLPADTRSGNGIFDFVPTQFEGDAGRFARWIKKESATHYGHVGRSLVNHYVQNRDGYIDDMRAAAQVVRAELDEIGGRSEPQVGRVCARFAFVAGAAIVACNRGLLPWSAESVTLATVSMFVAWFGQRGGIGSQEGLSAEKAFSAFYYANSDRFGDHEHQSVRSRLGITQKTADNVLVLWVAHDDGLVEMLGKQPERVSPFLEHLQAGHSEEWEHVLGSGGRPKRDAPERLGLPKRAYCFRRKYPESGEAANDNSSNFLDREVAG